MNNFSVVLAILSIVFTAVGQMLLKIGANTQNTPMWIPVSLKPYLNRFTLPGYGILFMVTILSIYILEDMPLKVFFPFFISGNLIMIAVISHFLLHESFNKPKLIGIGLIIAGILIFIL